MTNRYYKNSFKHQVQKKDSRKPSHGSSAADIDLQKVLGNREFGNLLMGNVQAKMTVGSPNDIYEQEADRVSEKVVNMTDAQVQSKEVDTPQ
ncbi:MAG: hypothetical protein GY754_03355, partial [bacterium]|nr:hypothetical protein [bacterium]